MTEKEIVSESVKERHFASPLGKLLGYDCDFFLETLQIKSKMTVKKLM